MDGVVVAFFVPIVVFLVIVAPIWLVLHYRSKGRAVAGLQADEQQELSLLMARAEQMSERVEVLEGILDTQVSGWRGRQE